MTYQELLNYVARLAPSELTMNVLIVTDDNKAYEVTIEMGGDDMREPLLIMGDEQV